MEPLNAVNLIQFGTITVGILGCFLLWRVSEFKGIALLLFLTSLAAFINILEETGITRDWYLISPVFIMLYGPATYLAAKFAIHRRLNKCDFWHFLPVVPFLLLTSHTHIVIALGTIWRLIYTYFTASILLTYKKKIEEQRSDSDEYSLTWLVWLIIIMAVFNLVDLLRLNLQTVIPYQLNLFGQGINNLAWLIASMVIIYQFSQLGGLPKQDEPQTEQPEHRQAKAEEYQSIFEALHNLIVKNQWYLTPRLTLANISEYTGIQTRDISRAINLHTKQSFNEYINQFRVDTVCQRFRNNDKNSLTEIAFDAGFSSKASFNKVFKQVTGKTPSEYKASL